MKGYLKLERLFDMYIRDTHPTAYESVIEEEYKGWHGPRVLGWRLFFFASWILAKATRGHYHLSWYRV